MTYAGSWQSRSRRRERKALRCRSYPARLSMTKCQTWSRTFATYEPSQRIRGICWTCTDSVSSLVRSLILLTYLEKDVCATEHECNSLKTLLEEDTSAYTASRTETKLIYVQDRARSGVIGVQSRRRGRGGGRWECDIAVYGLERVVCSPGSTKTDSSE